jgi:hypothetical protein
MGRQDARKSDATLCRITFRRSRSGSCCFRLDIGRRCILEMDFLGSYDICESIDFFKYRELTIYSLGRFVPSRGSYHYTGNLWACSPCEKSCADKKGDWR